MIQPRLVWELTRKDLMVFAADRRGALLCFAVPILLASAFGAIFHRSEEAEGLRPQVLVVSEGATPLDQRIAQALCASEQVRASIGDRAVATRRLANESGVVVVLPEGIGKLRAARKPRVELWHAPRAHWEARWVEGVVTEIVLREAARELLSVLGKESMVLERPFTVERRVEQAGGALSVNAFSHSFCGMTIQYLLFWGMDSGLLLLRERRGGIWRRLRAAPLGTIDLLAGRALSTAIVALAQIAVTFAVGFLCFGVTITGSVLGFGLMAIAASILAAATGLLVAALGGSEGRARSIAILVILTLSLLGGLWLPSFLLPGWAQRLALALPTTWAARGLEGVTWQGMSLGYAWPCALMLLGFSGLFLVIAWWRLARTADQPIHGLG